MDLHQLETFVVVAEELHFGRAAARLQLSQPPVTQRIQQLERDLGVQLFTRSSRRVALTHAGRVLIDEARRAVEHATHITDLARRAQQGMVGVIRIGYVGSALMGPLPGILRSFRARAPQVELRLQEGLSPELSAALEDGALDVVLEQPPVAVEGVHARVIDEQPMIAVLPSDHRLASGDGRLSLMELAEEGFVLFPRVMGPGYLKVVFDACRALGFTPNIVRDASAIYSMVGFVAAGQGVSLVPAAVAGLQIPGVAYRSLQEDATFSLVLAWRVSLESEPIVGQFVEHASAQRWT